MLTREETAEDRRLALQRAFWHSAVCFGVQIPIIVLYFFSEQGYVVQILYYPLFATLGNELYPVGTLLLIITAHLYSLLIATGLFFWRRYRDGEWRRPASFRIKRYPLLLAAVFILGSVGVSGLVEYRTRLAHADDIKCTVLEYQTTAYAEWGEHHQPEYRCDGVKVRIESGSGVETVWLIKPWVEGKPVGGYHRVGTIFYAKKLREAVTVSGNDYKKTYYWYPDSGRNE
jgi:hypothetical protein